MHYSLSAAPLLLCAGCSFHLKNQPTWDSSSTTDPSGQHGNHCSRICPSPAHQFGITKHSQWRANTHFMCIDVVEEWVNCYMQLLAFLPTAAWKANYLVFHISHFHCRSGRYLNHLSPFVCLWPTHATFWWDTQMFFPILMEAFERISTITEGQKSKLKPRVTKSPKPKFFHGRNNSYLH